MAQQWPVFITAARAPPKVVNRALLLIQDFEYTKYPEESQWTLLTSKDLPNVPPPATAVPLPNPDFVLARNAFTSMSLVEINTFVRTHEDSLKEIRISSHNWVVIDQKGFETSTCLVCEQYYNPGEEYDGEGEGGITSEFRACRLPWEETLITFCNLDIANMSFEDFVDEEAGEQADGSWRWRSCIPNTKGEEIILTAAEEKREKALKALRDNGFVD
ncbi:hypothetical protein MVEN_01724100 [Mycena venus]|uniref:Uncharacterized protein n=1 Tax=Mycena venus TaxID=2733690 RepID=A0A8H7CNX2_9AGAR|nr:hypothetical protein MVEN_01724100 [Mycena venus]